MDDCRGSLALSAYSAVMLRKMLPVHTNKMDVIVFTSSRGARSMESQLWQGTLNARLVYQGESLAASPRDILSGAMSRRTIIRSSRKTCGATAPRPGVEICLEGLSE
jgi:hypothetical protein